MAPGETFTAVLADTNGVLSANTGAAGGGGTITPSNGGKTLTIAGTLAQVNADLTTLTDTDAITPSDTITVTASDSNGGNATPAHISVTVNGLPVVAVPGAQTVGVGKVAAIAGVSISETGNSGSPESFTVTLSDANGDLSATGATAGNGTNSLTITGSLSAVNTALGTLTDTDTTAGPDLISVNATDSFGNSAIAKTIAVTVNGPPVIAVPGAQTVGVDKVAAISGVSVSETGNTGSPESFTVTVSDANGDLSATGATAGNGTNSLTITGSLSAVNTALATLTDTDATTGPDLISVNATDSFGNAASAKTIAVTVNGLPVIAVPGAQTVGVGKAAAITGVSVSETGNSGAPETFTVTVSDAIGELSATGATGNGTTSLTITGSLGAVNTALGTLTDTDPTAGPDLISVNATDSFGNTAIAKTIAVTANGLPVIAVPGAQTVGVGKVAAIAGVSVSETGNTGAPESFTVTLTDANGDLSATGATAGNGTNSLTITGSLSAVNTALGTLTDTDATAGPDLISVNASDSFGNVASTQTIAVTANGLPAITVPGAQTVGVGKVAVITGVSVSETGNTGLPETFTVTLTDANGDLSATGATAGNGTTSLTITGALSTVNTALGTLADTDPTAGPDLITVNATDSIGNAASSQTIAVTANGLPVITAPANATVAQNVATAVSGVSIAETGNTAGETFTAVLADTNGVLAANTGAVGGGGTVTPSNGGTTLTIAGTLAQVNADLTTLTDDDASTAPDTITVNASDSFGNAASQASIAVTVTLQSGALSILSPATATVGVGQAGAIAGVSIAESPVAPSETFTVTLTDANGKLSATGATAGNNTTNLTISGSLSAVNAALATLTDNDATTPSDTITLTASDSLGGNATPASIAVTVNSAPVIAVPGAQTVGVGKIAAISGVSVSETGNTGSPETFTVTLTDANGDLSATGATAGNGTNSLTISGSLSAVNTALGTLTDTDTTAGPDLISVNATDSFGNSASTQTIAVTANGLPVIAVPGAQTVGVGKTAAIAGISVSETGNSGAPESFTVTVSDASGDLSATGATGNGTTSLTITGSLSAVNTALGTLTDTDPTAGPDLITLTASDSFGNAASTKTIAVTANGVPVITAPATATAAQSAATAIPSVSLAESGNTAGETFTVTVGDSNGNLSATGASGNGTHSLTITGLLSTVNTELGSLTDTDSVTPSDTITHQRDRQFRQHRDAGDDRGDGDPVWPGERGCVRRPDAGAGHADGDGHELHAEPGHDHRGFDRADGGAGRAQCVRRRRQPDQRHAEHQWQHAGGVHQQRLRPDRPVGGRTDLQQPEPGTAGQRDRQLLGDHHADPDGGTGQRPDLGAAGTDHLHAERDRAGAGGRAGVHADHRPG